MAANAAASVSGGFVAISSASATASPSSSEPGTVRLIKPRRSASLASNVLPVRINSMAALRPTVPRQSLGAAERGNDPDVHLCLGEGIVLRRKGDVGGLD
jgi:hypothetical protein